MFRRPAFILVILILALNGVAAAGDWTLEGRVDGQWGDYDFAAIDPEYRFNFSVAVPRFRYLVTAKSPGGTSLGCLFAADETGDASMDPTFRKSGHGKYSGSPYGRTKEMGVEIGRRIIVKGLSLEPTLSYRETQMVTGACNAEDFDYDSDKRIDTYAFGLDLRGFRLGLRTSLPLAAKWQLDLEGGVAPGLTVSELRQVTDDETPLAMGDEHNLNWRTPHDQSSRLWDLSARVTFRPNELFELSFGYRREDGRFDFDLSEPLPKAKCMADLYELTSETIQFSGLVRF